MSIYDFAMQMELDGKAYYEDLAAKTDLPQLKKVLLEMASDEQKHYNLFKAMKDGEPAGYDAEQATTIFDSVKNVFEQLKESGDEFSGVGVVRDGWAKAREVEKKAEDFYRQKADEVDDPNQKQILLKIADEEHKHWTVIDHVISFLDQPGSWLENAEWGDLG
ncbi:MAG: ferritin family protein [candidate division Zixibacteria bacterium]|nr:ferritin family protein [candidate division Zixibacteria bacterium]MDH4032349.1 ferritin family protein [candidate division Zixibacteria bacterium]